MTTTVNKQSFQPDNAVHITFEDQQSINKFARHNAKAEDLKEELKNKTNDLQNLEDAVNELELMDDDEQIPFLVGEVFVYQDLQNTQEPGKIGAIRVKYGAYLYLMDDTFQPHITTDFITRAIKKNSLTEAKDKILQDIKNIKAKTAEITEAMSELKTLLYAKFGNQINLDDE